MSEESPIKRSSLSPRNLKTQIVNSPREAESLDTETVNKKSTTEGAFTSLPNLSLATQGDSSPLSERHPSEKTKNRRRKSVTSWVSKNIISHNSKKENSEKSHKVLPTFGKEDTLTNNPSTTNEMDNLSIKPRLGTRSRSEVMEKIPFLSPKDKRSTAEFQLSQQKLSHRSSNDSSEEILSDRSQHHSVPTIKVCQSESPNSFTSSSSSSPRNEDNISSTDELKPDTSEVVLRRRNTSGASIPVRAMPPPAPVIKSITNEGKRREILDELIQTEIQYIENLDIVLNIFLTPLRELNIFDKAKISSIFSNVEAIYPVNVALLKDLKELHSQILCSENSSNESDATGLSCSTNNNVCNNNNNNVGKIFSDKGDLFKLYAVYCSNQPNIHDRLNDLQEESEEFQQFLKRCFRRPECRRLDIESFLITPLQRLCKYPLLLKEFLKNTAEDHPEYEDIKEGKEKIEIIVNKVNERVRQVENVNRLIAVNKEISFNSFYFDILSDQNRVLEISDDLKIGGKSYYGYLFSDGLLLCTHKANQKEAKKFIPAKLSLATDIGDIPPDIVNRFELAEVGGKIMEIECHSKLAKKRWLMSFQKVIERAGGASKKDKLRAIKAYRRASLERPISSIPNSKSVYGGSKLKEEIASNHPQKENDMTGNNNSSNNNANNKNFARQTSKLNSFFGPSVKKITESFEKKSMESNVRVAEKKKTAQKINALEEELAELKETYSVIKKLLLDARNSNEEHLMKIKILEETILFLTSPVTQDNSSSYHSTSDSPSFLLSLQNGNPTSAHHSARLESKDEDDANRADLLNDRKKDIDIDDVQNITNESVEETSESQHAGDDSRSDKSNDTPRDSLPDDAHDLNNNNNNNNNINNNNSNNNNNNVQRIKILEERLHFLTEVVEKITEENVRLRSKLQSAKSQLKEVGYALNTSTDGTTS